MRQAADSEIIQLSMDIRNYNPIKYFNGNEVKVMRPRDVVTGLYTWDSQIITGTNKKRNEINSIVRTLKGINTSAPQIGDKIISLENHWGISDSEGNSALVNGTIGFITSIEENTLTYKVRPGFVVGPIPTYHIIFETEIGETFEVDMDKKYILTGQKSLSDKQEYVIYKSKNRPLMPELPCLFDYGYAITCHRGQGSEWPHVIVFEERFPFEKEEHARWLYTACTRASSRLVLIKN